MLVQSTEQTPVLNTKDFTSVFGGVNGNELKMDEKGHIRALEFIAFPGTIFTVIKSFVENKGSSPIFQVRTDAYPGESLFIDNRFVKTSISKKKNRFSKT